MLKQFQTVNWKKRVTLLVFVCLISTIVLFRGYIASQTNHSHINVDSGCSVCINVQMAEYLLRQVGMATKTILLTSVFFSLSFLSSNQRLIFESQKSLVKLKIRMDN